MATNVSIKDITAPQAMVIVTLDSATVQNLAAPKICVIIDPTTGNPV